MLGNLIVTTNGSHKHNAFKYNIILSIAIDKVVVQELNQVGAMHDLIPLISMHIHHGAKKFDLKIGVFSAVL